MARIAGVDIPREKRLEISLTYIFGIGRTTRAEDLRRHRHRPRHPGPRPHRRRGQPHPRRTSTPTSGSRATCAATSPRTSSARWRSAATRASATARACRCGVSAPTPTPAPARARRRRSPARRRREEVDGQAEAGGPSPPQEGTQERHLRRGAHQELVQQHHRLHHRHRGQRPLPWASAGNVGFKGSRKSHALRRPAGRREGRPRGPWSTACARSTCW